MEDLAKFVYKLKYENKKIYRHPSVFWATFLEPCLEKIWGFFPKFWSNSGYWKSQKALDLSTFNF